MRRGLTMIELLVSLGILSAVMLATVAWIQSTSQAVSFAQPMRFRAAAQAVLQLIHDDLRTGDFDSARSGRTTQPKVDVDNGALQLRTRALSSRKIAGPVIHRYTLDRLTGELQLHEENGVGRQATRLLLDQVRQWELAIAEDNSVLTVSITSHEHQTIRRRYRLP